MTLLHLSVSSTRGPVYEPHRFIDRNQPPGNKTKLKTISKELELVPSKSLKSAQKDALHGPKEAPLRAPPLASGVALAWGVPFWEPQSTVKSGYLGSFHHVHEQTHWYELQNKLCLSIWRHNDNYMARVSHHDYIVQTTWPYHARTLMHHQNKIQQKTRDALEGARSLATGGTPMALLRAPSLDRGGPFRESLGTTNVFKGLFLNYKAHNIMTKTRTANAWCHEHLNKLQTTLIQ